MSMGLMIAILTGMNYALVEYGEPGGRLVYEIRMGQAPAHLQDLSWLERIDYRSASGERHTPAGSGSTSSWGLGPERRSTLRSRKLFWRPSWATSLGGRYLRRLILGAPLYSNAAGINPGGRGPAWERALAWHRVAFMMSIIGISFPEARHLRKYWKPS